MALRWLGLLAILSPSPALAERRTWQDICAFVLTRTDEGRGEVEAFTSTSIGGGLDRYRGGGVTTRLHFARGWLLFLEAHLVSAQRRLTTPVPVAQPTRLGGGAGGIGWTPFVGKLAFDDRIFYFDVVTSAGAGIVFMHADDRLAFVAEATLRLRLTDSITLDLGIHDEFVPFAPGPDRVARMTSPALVLPPSRHEVEVRLGIGVWIPDAPGRRCNHRCTTRSPLADAPPL
ncbi:MAG: hypothetical protein H0T46_22320 [Deltaproteobacteria bacterium]|nr:hypothetical protein [Deltaproteobacteria bacterium]